MSPHVADINRFSYDAVHRVLGSVFEHDLHAKRVESLCKKAWTRYRLLRRCISRSKEGV